MYEIFDMNILKTDFSCINQRSLFQTFKPKKKFAHGTIRYSLHKQACASLNSGINLRTAVKLPPGEDLNDWIAVHGV